MYETFPAWIQDWAKRRFGERRDINVLVMMSHIEIREMARCARADLGLMLPQGMYADPWMMYADSL